MPLIPRSMLLISILVPATIGVGYGKQQESQHSPVDLSKVVALQQGHILRLQDQIERLNQVSGQQVIDKLQSEITSLSEENKILKQSVQSLTADLKSETAAALEAISSKMDAADSNVLAMANGYERVRLFHHASTHDPRNGRYSETVRLGVDFCRSKGFQFGISDGNWNGSVTNLICFR